MSNNSFKTLDKQWDYIPKEVIFCKNCVVSNQRPRTTFNSDGICSACQWALEKDTKIDWEKREHELQILCDKFRSRNGSFDIVVPGSGGKDSAFVAHQLKYRYKMNPLCVTWSPFEFTEIGWKNLNEFVNSGFTNILGQPDGKIHKKLTKLAFELKGDAWEPFAYGQKSWAFHIATKFNIKLIMYGENGELEYGGSEKYKNLCKEGPEEWEHEYYKGSSIDDLIHEGVNNLDELFWKSDFAIVSGGYSKLEAAITATPSAMIATKWHQITLAEEFHKITRMPNLGYMSFLSVNKIKETLVEYEDKITRKNLAKGYSNIIDGMGMDRVFSLIKAC